MAQALLPVSMAEASSAGTQARVPVPLGRLYESRKMFVKKKRIYELALQTSGVEVCGSSFE